MPSEVETATPAKLMVGLAGLEVSDDPNGSLCTLPLGAGLGLAIYDPVAKAGGVLHSLLPDSSLDPKRAASHPGMFLDTGLEALLSRLLQLKATRGNLQVFAAGAAQIIDEAPLFNIGKSNSDSLVELLTQLGMEICAQAVGGRTDCSLELILATGEVQLRFSGRREPTTLCKP